MSNITIALVTMLSLTVIMFLGQTAVIEINPSASNFYNCQGSALDNLGDCSSYQLSDTDPAGVLPTSETGVSAETGNVYTDTPSGIKTFFLNTLGLGYVLNLLSAPFNLLKSIGLPGAFAYAVGGLWYGVMILLFVAFILGRTD